MINEIKIFLYKCQECIETGVVLIASIITDRQQKTIRNVLINISFFSLGYWVADFAHLDKFASLIVAFTTGRYTAQLDNHLSDMVERLPEILKTYWRKR